MKVLDEHILEYIWDETLDRIAQETLVTYIGGSVGPNSFVINSDVVKDAAVQEPHDVGAQSVCRMVWTIAVKPLNPYLLTLCREAFLS